MRKKQEDRAAVRVKPERDPRYRGLPFNIAAALPRPKALGPGPAARIAVSGSPIAPAEKWPAWRELQCRKRQNS